MYLFWSVFIYLSISIFARFKLVEHKTKMQVTTCPKIVLRQFFKLSSLKISIVNLSFDLISNADLGRWWGIRSYLRGGMCFLFDNGKLCHKVRN